MTAVVPAVPGRIAALQGMPGIDPAWSRLIEVPDGAGDSFEERFAEFVAKTRETIDHVKDATDEVGRLDRLM